MSTQHNDFMEATTGDRVVYHFLGQQFRAGCYSFSGSCAPTTGNREMCKTFSVGVFQWQPRPKGDGITPGKTLIRVTGMPDNPNAVYEMAMDLCRRLQNGERFPFKSISAARYLESAA